jgi:DNA-directed RNA polymerase specialized sigma24 family protein
METEQLIEDAKRGNDAALDLIVSRHWDMCVKAAYARIGDVHLAEDAAQEALITAPTQLHRLRLPGHFFCRRLTLEKYY